jgi:hypothetical protein
VYDKVIVRTSFGSLLVDDEDDRPALRLAGLRTCSVKQKHSSLRKCGAAVCGCVARERLRRHRAVLAVAELVHHRHDLAGMDLDARRLGPEVPRAARVGIELDGHRAREVDLRARRRIAHALLLGARDHVDAERLADRAVDRHQRVAEREHHRDDDDELADHAPVVGDEARDPCRLHRGQPKTVILAMKPTKKTIAIDARISARRRFALLRRSSATSLTPLRRGRWRRADDLGAGGVEQRRRLEGVERRRRRHLPLEALGAFPRLLRRLLALAAHHRQHDREQEVHLRQPKPNAPIDATMLKSVNCIG